MFYQQQKTSWPVQRNLKPVSRPQTTAKASNSHPHIPSSIGTPSKEGELHCYKHGQKGHIKPQCPKLKGKQRIARAQIKDLIEENEETSESLTSRAPNDALDEVTYPQEGEEYLKNTSQDNKDDQPQYKWDDQEYKANFVCFINEELIIDTTIQVAVAAGTVDKVVDVGCIYVLLFTVQTHIQ